MFIIALKSCRLPFRAVMLSLGTIALAALLGGCGSLHSQPESAVYQKSTLSGLLVGDYDADTTVGELLRHGDFGIGTFEGLDGEMIVLDGVCRRVGADGTVAVMEADARTPFATVVWFHADRGFKLPGGTDFATARKELDAQTAAHNYFHAIKIRGAFKSVKVRSVPKQVKPYPPLTEVTKNQPVFNVENIAGTLIGFRTPDYVGTIGVPGYHFHFLSDDGTAGGHLLDFVLATPADVELQEAREFHLSLPGTSSFRGADLGKGTGQDVMKAEK